MSSGSIAPGTIPGAGGKLRLNSLATTGGTLQFDVGGALTDSINITNGVTFSGSSLALNLAGNVTNGQVLTLITAGSNLPTSGLSMSAATMGRTTLSPFITGNTLRVAVTGGPATMTWVGGNNSGAWDEQITQNWNDVTYNVNPDIFYDVDAVTFDDTASNFSPVLSGVLSPGSVTFNNSLSHAYALSGTGGIAGMTSVVKNGTGTITLSTANSYTGGTIINAGLVQVNSAASLGAASGDVTMNGGMLEATASQTTSRNFKLGGSSSKIEVDSGAVVTINGTIADGASVGTLNLEGAGTLSLTAANTFTGGTNISAASTLRIAQSGSVVGTLAGGAVSDDGTLAFALAGTTTDVFSNTLTGFGTIFLLQSSASTVDLTGNNTGYTGSAHVSGGTRLQISGPSAGFGTAVVGSAISVVTGGGLYWNTGQDYGGALSLGGKGFTGDGGTFGALRADTGTPTFSGPITLLAAAEIYSDTTTTLSGNATGAFPLLSAGSGRLVLSGTNTYTGGTGIESGTLQLGSAAALPSTGGVTLGSATAIGTQPANASGVLDLNGFSPTVTALAMIGTGTSNVIGNSSTTSNSTLTFAGGTGSSTFAGIIADRIPGVTSSQTTALTVSSGTLSLTGADTYTGATSVTGGTLNIGSGGSIVSTSVSVSSGATLQLIAGGSFAVAPNVADAGTFNLFGSGGINTLTGAGNVSLFGSTLTLANGGTFTGKILSSGNVVLSGGTLSLSNAHGYTGSTTVNGGTLALTGTGSLAGNNYTIGSAGTFTIASGASIPSTANLTVNGAVTFNSATPTISSLSGASSGVVTLNNGGNLFVTGGGTYAGVIQNGTTAASLTVGGGTLTLSGANTYTGSASINSGVLNFTSISNLGAGTAVNFGGGTLQYASGNTTDISSRTITINAAGAGIDTSGNNVTFANAIGNGGSGGLTKAGLGTLTLSAGGTYTGATNVDAGRLVFGASYTAGAKLNVANGAVAQLAGAGTLLRTQTIALNSTGTLDLTGDTLDIHYGTGAAVDSAVRSLIIQGRNGGTWTGTGITSSHAAVTSGGAVGYADGADGVVPGLAAGDELVKYTLAGDANLDGTVSFSDFQVLAENFGASGKWDQADFNYDGQTSFSDFQLLAENFGNTASLSTGQIASLQSFAEDFGDQLITNPSGQGFTLVAVPEPASLSLLSVGAVGLLARRRRR